MLLVFLTNLLLTLVSMIVVTVILRRVALEEDAAIRKRWHTEMAAMESAGRAKQEYIEERLQTIERQIAVMEGRVELIDRAQKALRLKIERGP